MIKLIIFDLDDCLIDTWGAAFPITLEESIKTMVNKGLKIDSFEKAVSRLMEINNRSPNCSEAITEYLNEIGADPVKYIEVGKRAIYGFDYEVIKPIQGVPEMLEKLSSLKIGLVIITKGEKEKQIKKMKTAGIDPNKFKRIYAVTDYDKTEPYRQIMDELNCSANNILIVGDRYETDLIPGKNLGIKVAWIPWGRGKIRPPRKEDVDYIIDDFNEIVNIVKK